MEILAGKVLNSSLVPLLLPDNCFLCKETAMILMDSEWLVFKVATRFLWCQYYSVSFFRSLPAPFVTVDLWFLVFKFNLSPLHLPETHKTENSSQTSNSVALSLVRVKETNGCRSQLLGSCTRVQKVTSRVHQLHSFVMNNNNNKNKIIDTRTPNWK
jgi:hypothetical protein